MVNADMRLYDYYRLMDLDEYGQHKAGTTPEGKIKIAINTLSQNTEASVLYQNATYIGLTTDAGVDDTYIIEMNEERLKVLYVSPKGRYKQVFMARMG